MTHTRKGPWVEERMLGSGGFGEVTLWKNEESGNKIALKKCRLQKEMTVLHKQRWQLEVQIMQRLEHENVIGVHVVPEALDVTPPELPLLAMEYCSGGDLRRILSQPQNCCGLSEYTVRCIVHDIAAGVEYLHSKRIIHRDLKPENIVLKPVDDRTVYKVIDLGYAKELDQGSVCTSFVGTLQYLAPELYTSKKYTCTVDYWSFGTVIFECIAGYRPFLPNSPPMKWHSEVCKKSPDDICARLDVNEEVKLYKTIPTPNRLCRSMQAYMEQWLRMMLRWDPKARGGGLSKENRPNCFSMLDNMLQMKIIYILRVATNELLTYPVLEHHTVQDLQKRIEEETHLSIDDQDIILATGMTPSRTSYASHCWMEPCEQECFVYLFKKGGEDCSQDSHQPRSKQLPPAVGEMVREPTTIIPYTDQKKAWAEAVFFCEEQHLKFKRLVLSQRAAMLSLIRKDSAYMKVKSKMVGECDQLMSKVDYFLESLNHDLKLYKEQANNGGLSSDKMYKDWMKMAEEVESFKKMKDKVEDYVQQTNIIETKFVELQKSPFARSRQDDTLQDLAKQAKHAYEDFRQAVKEHKNAVRDQKPMVTVVVKCLMWMDKKLPDLYAHLGKIGANKADISRLMPQVEECTNQLQMSAQQLLRHQKHRQTGVWRLVSAALKQEPVSEGNPNLSDSVDSSNECRRESQPTPTGQTTPLGASLMASMCQSSTPESLQVMEDARVTTKLMEEAMNKLILEQEEFSSKFSLESR